MKSFKFNVNDTATIITSGERGVIIGRAEYSNAEFSYLIRYKCGDGRAIEAWWTESALVVEANHE